MFSTLDQTKGYHQMKLAEKSKEITALRPIRPFSMKGFTNGDENFQGGFPDINGSNVRKFAA